jgi:transcriptional regulator with XRE-family HTH domain
MLERPMTKKSPNPIDKHVGSRVRMRRMMISMSQEKLGEKLGITFQQIQKYEKGTNRIGASRLQQISQILQVPVSFFFEGAPTQAAPADGAAFDARIGQTAVAPVCRRRLALCLLRMHMKAGGAMLPVFILLLWYVFGRGFRALFLSPMSDVSELMPESRPCAKVRGSSFSMK